MKTQQELYKKYLADVAKLQSQCKHEKISDWMQQQWAPAHSTGFDVRICEVCSMIVDKRADEAWEAFLKSNIFNCDGLQG